MKIYKILGTSIIAISLLGCETSISSTHTQKQNSTKNQPSNHTQQDQNSQSTENSPNGDSSGSEHNSTGSLNEQTPLRREQEVLKQLGGQLKTKVPFIIPKNVPLAEGKYLTATTTFEMWYYQIKLYETDQPAAINSQAAANGKLIASVEGTEYKDEVNAQKAINGYVKADISQNSIDLGPGIKGTEDAGAGHSYVIWNEGRWSIKVDSPNDPTYKNKQYPDGVELAKKIVTYLHDHTLPAPQKIGVITIRNWQKEPQTTIQWQDHKITYQITSSDPMTALEIAVHSGY